VAARACAFVCVCALADAVCAWLHAGKSSQNKMLVEALQAKGVAVEAMCFPDRTTPIGKIINSYLASATDMDDHALHLLFSSNRWEAEGKIRSLLEAGTTVVCDRYAFSGIAYTGAKGVDLDWCAAPDAGLPAPDLTLYLEVPVEVAEARGEYGEERYEKREFQAKVRTAFEGLKARFPEWQVVDGQPPPPEVHAKVLALAEGALASAAGAPIGTLKF
jgi:dTMP kinase